LKQQQLIERVILVYIILFQNFLDAFTEAAEQPLMAYATPPSFNTEMTEVVHFCINKTDLILL
jgi:hypothetical protein